LKVRVFETVDPPANTEVFVIPREGVESSGSGGGGLMIPRLM